MRRPPEREVDEAEPEGCAHCCTEHATDAWAPVELTWSVIRPGDIILAARTRLPWIVTTVTGTEVTAVRGAATAHDKLDQVRADAAAQVAAAQTRGRAAPPRGRDAQARDRVEKAETTAAARIIDADRAAEDARAEARTQILAAQQQAAAAGSAQTRADADRAAAERRATEDRATLDRLRAELEQLRTDPPRQSTATPPRPRASVPSSCDQPVRRRGPARRARIPDGGGCRRRRGRPAPRRRP